mmetsp:Transcript_15221/g.23906  ORF Transcript_15221/g.23906 Transcript_15221/m.23906 type:complete len:297 (+) Transcript_15221:697-1587(+)
MRSIQRIIVIILELIVIVFHIISIQPSAQHRFHRVSLLHMQRHHHFRIMRRRLIIIKVISSGHKRTAIHIVGIQHHIAVRIVGLLLLLHFHHSNLMLSEPVAPHRVIRSMEQFDEHIRFHLQVLWQRVVRFAVLIQHRFRQRIVRSLRFFKLLLVDEVSTRYRHEIESRRFLLFPRSLRLCRVALCIGIGVGRRTRSVPRSVSRSGRRFVGLLQCQLISSMVPLVGTGPVSVFLCVEERGQTLKVRVFQLADHRVHRRQIHGAAPIDSAFMQRVVLSVLVCLLQTQIVEHCFVVVF